MYIYICVYESSDCGMVSYLSQKLRIRIHTTSYLTVPLDREPISTGSQKYSRRCQLFSHQLALNEAVPHDVHKPFNPVL